MKLLDPFTGILIDSLESVCSNIAIATMVRSLNVNYGIIVILWLQDLYYGI